MFFLHETIALIKSDHFKNVYANIVLSTPSCPN